MKRLIRHFACFSVVILSGAIFLSGAISHANADFVANVDFGRNDNTTAGYNNIGDAASGNVTSGDTYDILDLSSNDTGVDLTINPNVATGGASGSFAGTGADYTGTIPAVLAGIASTATMDSIFIRNTNNLAADPTAGARVEFGLTGLDAGSTYDLLIYGARGNNGGTSTHYFVSDDGGLTYTGQSFDVFENSSNVAQFSGLSGSSSISLIMTTDDLVDGVNTNGAINFMQITATAVPEPASASLLAIAGIGCLLRRRK